MAAARLLNTSPSAWLTGSSSAGGLPVGETGGTESRFTVREKFRKGKGKRKESWHCSYHQSQAMAEALLTSSWAPSLLRHHRSPNDTGGFHFPHFYSLAPACPQRPRVEDVVLRAHYRKQRGGPVGGPWVAGACSQGTKEPFLSLLLLGHEVSSVLCRMRLSLPSRRPWFHPTWG